MCCFTNKTILTAYFAEATANIVLEQPLREAAKKWFF